MFYARIVAGVVAEIIVLPDDVLPASIFHESIASEMVQAPENVEQNWTYVEGAFSPPPVAEVDLDAVKANLYRKIDTEAENVRLTYITPGAGQAMTYQQKVDEARRFKETGEGVGDYPMLSAEIGITAKTLDEIADIVLVSFAQWQVVGAAIEGLRLGAKKKVEAAKTEKTANSAAVIDWP